MSALLDCYLPVFRQVLDMIAEPASFTEYTDARQACLLRLERAFQLASQLDISEEEKADAQFAVIAWVDETVLCSSLPWCEHWQSELLQRKYLNITVAGERFFTSLAQLDPAHHQARRVFLFCLQNGFHGQYSAPDDDAPLQEIIAEQRALCLPESWQSWPNDSAITPATCGETVTTPLHKRLLLRSTLMLLLLYGFLFLLLYHYAN